MNKQNKQAPKSVRNFSFEWNMYKGNDECGFDLLTEPQLTPEDFRDKVVLDAGCGNGRLLKLCSELKPKMVVGIDLSDAVKVARLSTKDSDNDNVHIVRGSLYNLPFKDNSFDLIYSIGVLHHTPDPKQAFKSLPPLLKSGGTITVRLYQQYHLIHQFVINLIRGVTIHIPHHVLYKICWIQRPLGDFVFRI